MKVTIDINGKPTTLDIKYVNGQIEAYENGERVYLSFLQMAEVKMELDKDIKQQYVNNFTKALASLY